MNRPFGKCRLAALYIEFLVYLPYYIDNGLLRFIEIVRLHYQKNFEFIAMITEPVNHMSMLNEVIRNTLILNFG